MANQYFEVITLLDSDEEDSKVEAAAPVRNGVTLLKTTARKSVKSKMPVVTVKKEPPSLVSQPSVQDSSNNIQTTMTSNHGLPRKSARKSFPNSNTTTKTQVVTSPKLSLKRKQSENVQNSTLKKLKVDSAATKTIPSFDDQESNSIHSDVPPRLNDRNKAIPLPYSPSTNNAFPKVDLNKVIPLPYIESTHTDVAKPKKVISLPSLHAAPTPPSSCKQSNKSVPWNSTDDNPTKCKKLLEFSKAFMAASTDSEKNTIVKNVQKCLDKASPVYINSAEFDFLLNDTLNKMKDSKNAFLQLVTLKTELKAYKMKKESNSSRQSSSSERSDTTRFVSNFGLFPSKPTKEVPEPILVEHLASAILSATSKLKQSHEGIDTSCPLSNVPSTSQQADIIENFRLSMPPVNDFKKMPSTSKQADNLHSSLPLVNNAISKSDLRNEPSTSKQQDMLIEGCNDKTSDSGMECRQSVQIAKNLQILDNHSSSPVKEVFHKQTLQNMSLPDADQPNRNRADSLVNSDGAKLQERSLNPLKVELVTSSRNLESTEGKLEKQKLQEKNLNPPKVELATSSRNLESTEGKLEKRVKFLENYLAKLDKKIKKLQSKEMSLDDLDEEDSTYILEDRYKRKFQKTWITLCRIKKRSHLVGREMDRRFTYKGSRHDSVNKAIERLINKRKVAEKFPYYVEVLNLIQKISDETHLSLRVDEVEREAREAFEYIGNELKKRRQADEEKDFGCYLTDNIIMEPDPADMDEELNAKLSSSVIEGERKIKEIIDKYASQQKEKEPGDESEGSDCDDPHNAEPVEEGVPNSMVEGNTVDLDNLPDTDPATPETDEREASPETVRNPTPTALASVDNVIEIDSSSDASTEPGRSKALPLPILTTFYPSEGIFINDDIEIVEDNQQIDTDSSPDLPSISELCR